MRFSIIAVGVFASQVFLLFSSYIYIKGKRIELLAKKNSPTVSFVTIDEIVTAVFKGAADIPLKLVLSQQLNHPHLQGLYVSGSLALAPSRLQSVSFSSLN